MLIPPNCVEHPIDCPYSNRCSKTCPSTDRGWNEMWRTFLRICWSNRPGGATDKHRDHPCRTLNKWATPRMQRIRRHSVTYEEGLDRSCTRKAHPKSKKTLKIWLAFFYLHLSYLFMREFCVLRAFRLFFFHNTLYNVNYSCLTKQTILAALEIVMLHIV